MPFKEKTKIKALPESPGVYLMRDSESRIIYAGKAINLRKRVASYFGSSGDFSQKTVSLVSNIKTIDYITTGSEKEALILEYNLIKKFRPKYNVLLRDDKTYPYLKITTRDDFPLLQVVRKKNLKPADFEGDVYFGPYPDAGSLRKALKLIRRIFPLVRCTFGRKKAIGSPGRCLYFQMKQCAGPCYGKIGVKKYGKIVDEVTLFLAGKNRKLIRALKAQMKTHSKHLEFEQARAVRDRLFAVENILEKINLKRIDAGQLDFSGWKKTLKELKELLGLRKTPFRIEAFDVSNISGKAAVGSMVTFVNAVPEKSGYRRFRIRSMASRDDVAMMKEIVHRRYRLKTGLPDLIIIDGGRGHSNAAKGVLEALGIKNVPLIGLAKAEETICVPGTGKPLWLDRTSGVLHFMQHVRDEAHRFAVNYHRKIRDKNIYEKNT